MTRLLYLPDDSTIIQMEVQIPPKQLTATINSGTLPLPVLYDNNGHLNASQIGQTVIVSPRRRRGRPAKPLPHDNLTRRQRQVLELASKGYSNADIAAMLNISRRTVSYHLKGIRTQISVTPQSLIAENTTLLNLDQKSD